MSLPMNAVIVASNRPGLGKTALAAALVSRRDRPTAYLRVGGEAGNQEHDTAYLAGLIASGAQPGVDLPPTPRANPETQSAASLAAEVEAFAAEAASRGRGLVVEVAPSEGDAARAWTLSRQIAEACKGYVVAMVDYGATSDMEILDADLQPIGERLWGILVNGAPPYRTRETTGRLQGAAERSPRDAPGRAGKLLGVIPEDRTMLAPTVGQLAQALNADWVLGEEKAGALVCHVLIGGNLMDPGVTYFGRHQDQAVIVRGDRPDIQLAALGCELSCLVLTGGHGPIPYVLHEAEEQRVPLLVVQDDTHATAKAVGGLVSRGVAHHPHKAKRYARMLDEHCQADLLAELLA